MAGIIRRAEQFATLAHAGQFLKTASREPFIEHPRRVVKLVELSIATDDEIAAAWLHDVVEDTGVTLDDIEKEFGEAIRELVDGLTDPLHFAGNPNNIRKKWQAERVKNKSHGVKRVKIADQTVNTHLMTFDPPVGWTLEHRLAYVEGAKWIVDECQQVNDYLEKLFYEAYENATREIKAM